MLPKQPKVFVIIPVHNRKHFTYECLDSLTQQSYNNISIVVVDDGSTDGTSEMIARCFSEVKVLHGDGYLWWTGAINFGIKEALRTATHEDFILVINDDVIVGPDYITNLLSICSKNPASIIGSVVVDHDTPDLIRLGGTKINWITAKFINVNKGRSLSEFPEGYCEYASYLTGRGTLFPVEVFRSIGLYDDKHFQQCGDTELPVRASRKGYKLLVSYSAVVYNQAESMEKFDARKTYKLRDLKRYFFDIKSNSRLRYAYHFAKNTSRNPLQFLVFLFCDIARKNYHFFSRIRL